MAAYRQVYGSRHLQADCQELGSAPEPYARQCYLIFCVPMCLAAGSAENRHPSPDSEMNQPINTDRTFDISAAAGNPDDDVTVTSLASAAAANSGLVQGGPDVAAAAEDDGNVSTGTSIDFDEQTPATTQTVGRTASSKDDATGVSNAISVCRYTRSANKIAAANSWPECCQISTDLLNFFSPEASLVNLQ